MRRIVREVEEEGLLSLSSFVEKLQGVISKGIRRVEVLILRLEGLSIQAKRLVRHEVAARAAEHAEVSVESAIQRRAADVPLAGRQRRVAGATKDLRNGDTVLSFFDIGLLMV